MNCHYCTRRIDGLSEEIDGKHYHLSCAENIEREADFIPANQGRLDLNEETER